MKVYVVIEWATEDEIHTLGVFSTRERAETLARKRGEEGSVDGSLASKFVLRKESAFAAIWIEEAEIDRPAA